MLLKILLIISFLTLWLVIFKIQKNNMEILDETFKKYEDSVKREYILTVQKTKIMSIIVDAKKNNEISYQTLEKIEKELFKNNSK